MKEKFLMDLIGCYREYFPENIPVECRKTAALIVFRFAIPDEELDHICKLLIETELGIRHIAFISANRSERHLHIFYCTRIFHCQRSDMD